MVNNTRNMDKTYIKCINWVCLYKIYNIGLVMIFLIMIYIDKKIMKKEWIVYKMIKEINNGMEYNNIRCNNVYSRIYNMFNNKKGR